VEDSFGFALAGFDMKCWSSKSVSAPPLRDECLERLKFFFVATFLDGLAALELTR
jgi:hypothetical protein